MSIGKLFLRPRSIATLKLLARHYYSILIIEGGGGAIGILLATVIKDL